MSVAASHWVWTQSQAKGSDRLTLLAIADCADDDGGHAFPGIAYLMDKTKLPRSTVYECIRRLLACPDGCAEQRDADGQCAKHVGELAVDHQGEGRGDPTVYRVLMRQTRPKSVRVANGASGDGDGFPQFPQGDSSTGGTVQQPDGPVRDPSGGPDSTPLYEPRTVSNHARARARGDNPGRPQRLSPEVAVPGYSHADNAGHDPDPGDCAACGTAGSHRPASRATRRAALEAAGLTPSDWPDGPAVPPPGDPEAERARQKAVLAELIERGERP